MEQNIDKSKAQKTTITTEPAPVEPLVVGKFVSKDEQEDSDDELDLDVELDDDEPEDEPEIGEVEDSEPEKPEPKPRAKAETKEQRELHEVKKRAAKLEREKAELEKKLAEKADLKREEALAAKYAQEDGLDDRDARLRARTEIKQEDMAKQLEILLFEKKNRRVLEQYPEADDDLDRIMSASKASGMTVEQVCRGLYGTELSERDKRIMKAVTAQDDKSEVSNSVSKSMRTAAAPVHSKLSESQLKAKRAMEKMVNHGKPISDDDFLKCWNT